jgi:hypothetical protein
VLEGDTLNLTAIEMTPVIEKRAYNAVVEERDDAIEREATAALHITALRTVSRTTRDASPTR